MRKQCGNKWGKSWYNPRAGYPMFHYVTKKPGSSGNGWVTIVAFVAGLLALFLLRF